MLRPDGEPSIEVKDLLFALINNERADATPGLKGLCPNCSQNVTSKCGSRRIWHWAHVSKQACDSWWEETLWHRTWKSLFPIGWQEVILFDTQSGERHIADIRTSKGLVIELQHSPLASEERVSREKFYNNMVWVVDASHRKNDYKRFIKNFPRFFKTHKPGMFLVPSPEKSFPLDWVQSAKPVFFDFRGTDAPVPPDNGRELLWCLLPGRIENLGILVAFNRGDIIREATEQADLVEVLMKGHIEANNFLILSRRQRQPQIRMPFQRYPAGRSRRCF